MTCFLSLSYRIIFVHFIYVPLLGCSPAFATHPESTNVALGEKMATFKCEATGAPQLKYSWKFNGEVMKSETGDTLTIKNVNKKDEGKYQCCVENRYDRVASNSVELRIGKVCKRMPILSLPTVQHC